MIAPRPVHAAFLLTLVLAGALQLGGQAPAQEQAAQKPYEPQVGQEGKDVVWVPTSDALVEQMLDLAKLTPEDYLIDLGSGDGRTVIAAARRGVRAHGIEFNPEMVALSRSKAVAANIVGRATFEEGDLFESDLSKATVITMFLLPDINLKLRPTLLDLEPGTRIVSNSFDMGEWEEDERATVTEDCSSWCTALLWIVPAKVAGVWRLPQGTLRLQQEFQKISGTLGSAAISSGEVRGTEVTFTAGGVTYSGRLEGDTLRGTLKGALGGRWSATRAD